MYWYEYRSKKKNAFGKYIFELMANAVLGKTMENVRKQRDITLVSAERRNNYLVSNYHTTKFSTESLWAIEMKKTEILMNKPVYLGFLIKKSSKILMYEFWCDYVKLKYDEKSRLSHIL